MENWLMSIGIDIAWWCDKFSWVLNMDLGIEEPALRDYFMDKIISNTKMIISVILQMEIYKFKIWVNHVLVYLDICVTVYDDKYYHTWSDDYAWII